MAENLVESLILKLFEIQAVKFGEFTLKSGIQSPVYVDLRIIVSHPQLLREVCDILWQVAVSSKAEFSSMCGVPYTALPIASCISVKENVPMVMRRKEAKAYGTKKLIEGEFEKGSKCLIIEDVVTSGSSVMETVEALATVGLEVSDAIVLLDRYQGGSGRLQAQGINLHSALTLPKVIEVLLSANKINQEMATKVQLFLDKNQFLPVENSVKNPKQVAKNLTYQEREELATHPVTKRLFNIMHTKKSNLAVSADLSTVKEVLNLVEEVGPYVCIIKTHVDILEDFSMEFVTSLQELAAKHNFLIFEDRKFADIGNTVKLQYGKGVYKVVDWAHITNAHALPGDGVVNGLKEIGAAKDRGCLLIGQMSAEGNLASQEYTKLTVEMAERHKDFVIGFICTSNLSNDPQLLHMAPGVKLEEGKDDLGQQYLTPEEVIANRHTDVIIVGRGIYRASNPAQAAQAYQKAGYEAYLNRLKN